MAATRLRRLLVWLLPALALLAPAVGIGQPVAEATAPAAPGAVTGLTLTATTTRIAASWTAPSPAPTGKYLIQVFEGDSTTAIVNWKRTETKVVIPSLKRGTLYKVSVKAQNTSGDTSTAGPEATATTTTLNAAGAVTGLTLTATTTRITASWTAPDPKPTGGYIVKIFPGNSSTALRKAMTGKSKVSFKGLAPGTSYKVSVKALNKDVKFGTIASTEATATITTLSPPPPLPWPGYVSDLTLTPSFSAGLGHSITATWTAPDPAPTGAYFVQIFDVSANERDENGNLYPFGSLSRKPSNARFSNLKANNQYRVQVRAQNKEGKRRNIAQPVSETTTTLDVSLPEAPGQVTGLALKVTANSVLATWTPPDPTPTGNYLIELFEGDDSTVTDARRRKGTASKAHFINLKVSTTYKVSVTAHNKNDYAEVAGEAVSATATTSAASAGGLPGAPTNLTLSNAADKTDTTYTLSFSWDEAPGNGNHITHYVVVVKELDEDGNKVSSLRKKRDNTKKSFSYENAKIGTWYNLRIRAINALGYGPWLEEKVILEAQSG